MIYKTHINWFQGMQEKELLDLQLNLDEITTATDDHWILRLSRCNGILIRECVSYCRVFVRADIDWRVIENNLKTLW